jgi:hypothetical protein
MMSQVFGPGKKRTEVEEWVWSTGVPAGSRCVYAVAGLDNCSKPIDYSLPFIIPLTTAVLHKLCTIVVMLKLRLIIV